MMRSAKTFVRFLAVGVALGSFLSGVSASAEPSPPVISVAPNQYYPLDEALYLEGRAPARARVELLFEPRLGKAQPVRLSVEADGNGEWFFGERLELASGEWAVRARTLTDPPSDWSSPRIIRSVVSGIIVGGITLKYVPIVLALVAVSLFSGILLIYSMWRVRRARRSELEEELSEELHHHHHHQRK